MPFLPPIVTVALILFCIIHIVRTGADRIWLYVVIFLPMLGSLAYLAAEVVPAMLGGWRVRRLTGGALSAIDPERGLRRRAADLDLLQTADTKRRLAEEHLRLGRFEAAAELYESALTGVHQDDPALLLGLARARSGLGDHAAALAALDRLKAAEPDFQSADGHLIYAVSLEGLGRDAEALEELRALAAYAPGEEARCRYALLLQKMGRAAEAQALFQEVLARARHGSARYRRDERHWIETARRAASA